MTDATAGEPLGRLLIREIAAQSSDEVTLVARRMQATLVEVEGESNAARLHSLPWIRERLLWHIDNPAVLARVLVATLAGGEIVGHTVLRRETAPEGGHYGLFSTIYVTPPCRRRGVAARLLRAGEEWFRAVGLSTFSTWTSSTNTRLIRLYEGHGYRIARSGRHEVTGTLMVNMTRSETPTRDPA